MRSSTALLLCTLLLVHIIRASASATHSLPLDTTLPTALARPLPCRGKALANATAALKDPHIRLRAPPHWPNSDPVSAAYPSCSSWSSSQHSRACSSKHTTSQSFLFGGPVLSVLFAQTPPPLHSRSSRSALGGSTELHSRWEPSVCLAALPAQQPDSYHSYS